MGLLLVNKSQMNTLGNMLKESRQSDPPDAGFVNTFTEFYEQYYEFSNQASVRADSVKIDF